MQKRQTQQVRSDLIKLGLRIPADLGSNASDVLEIVTAVIGKIFPEFETCRELDQPVTSLKSVQKLRFLRYFQTLNWVIGAEKLDIRHLYADPKNCYNWLDRALNFIRFKEGMCAREEENRKFVLHLTEEAKNMKESKDLMAKEAALVLPENFEKEFENVYSTCEAWTKKIQTYEYEISQLEFEQKNLTKANTKLESETNKKEEEIQELRHRMENLQLKIVESPEDLRNRHISTKEALKRAKDESDQFREKMNFLLQKNKEIDTAMDATKNQIKQTSKIKQILSDVSDLQVKIKDKEAFIAELEASESSHQRKIIELQERIKVQEQENLETEQNYVEIVSKIEMDIESQTEKKQILKNEIEKNKETLAHNLKNEPILRNRINEMNFLHGNKLKKIHEILQFHNDTLQDLRLLMCQFEQSTREILKAELSEIQQASEFLQGEKLQPYLEKPQKEYRQFGKPELRFPKIPIQESIENRMKQNTKDKGKLKENNCKNSAEDSILTRPRSARGQDSNKQHPHTSRGPKTPHTSRGPKTPSYPA